MKLILIRNILCMAASLGAASISSAQAVVADSAAGFSGVQGQNGWSYGFFDGDGSAPFSSPDFEPLVFTGTSWEHPAGNAVGGFWTHISSESMHPNGPLTSGGRQDVEHWAVLRWESGIAASVRFSGNIADLVSGGADCDGLIGRIFIDGAEVYSVAIPEGDLIGIDFDFTAPVSIGSTIDFVVDPGNNDFTDTTRFNAVITVPEPAAATLSLLGAALCIRRRSLA